MTKNLSTSISGLCLAFLTACGGGGSSNDNTPTAPTIQDGNPEHPGTITVQHFANGQAVSLAKIEKDAQSGNYMPLTSYRGLQEHVSLLNDRRFAFALAAINGYTVGIGASVGEVYTPYKTTLSPYINEATGKNYTYEEMAAGVHSDRRIVIASNHNLPATQENFYAESTRHKITLHEICHAVYYKYGLDRSTEGIVAFTNATAQARYRNVLDKVPRHFRTTSDGGTESLPAGAELEAFAETCAETVYIRTLYNGPVEYPTRIAGYTDVGPLLPEYATYVQGALKKLEQDSTGKKYAYNIQPAPGDKPVMLTGPGL